MTEETDPEAQKEIDAEKKELGDLIQDIIKSLHTLRDELKNDIGSNREYLEKAIETIMERQSNITANQQLLFNQLKEVKEAKPA